MKTIEYVCKFCKGKRCFEVEWNEGCEAFNLKKWIPVLACDRCATYERKRRDTERAIMRTCYQLIADRIGMKMGGEALAKAEKRAVNRMTELIKAYAETICDYYRIETQYQPEYVDLCFEKPDRAYKALRVYHQVIRQMSETT